MLGGALTLLPRGMIGRAFATTALRLLPGGVAAAAIASVLQNVSLPAAGAAGATAYLILALVLGGIRLDELTSVTRLTRKSLKRLVAR
jgi:hypothetical protein